MPRNTDPADIAQNLYEYLAIEGFGLTAQRKNEILARVRGLSNHASAVRYDVRANQFFVMLLSLDDLTPTGYVLADTLSRNPLQECTSRAEANVLAEQEAALRNVPVIVCDANFENVAVFDEPPSSHQGGEYRCWEAVGSIRNVDAPYLDGEMCEDFEIIEPHLTSLREAVQCALAWAAAKGPTDETTSRLVVVATGAERTVRWRLYE